MVIPSASSTKKYVPPHLRNRAAESGYKAQPSDGQEKASPKAPGAKTISASVAGTQNAPIQLNAIEWGRLSDVSRSLDGITGVFFLYFDENVEPTFCLKLPDNPSSEHFGATLFKSLGLFAPDSRLISRDSAEFATLKTTLSNQSQYYEVEKRLFEHSDRLHDLYSKLNSLDANQGHILLMDCIPGCSLEEVRRVIGAMTDSIKISFIKILAKDSLRTRFCSMVIAISFCLAIMREIFDSPLRSSLK